jgi:hypothetical protein
VGHDGAMLMNFVVSSCRQHRENRSVWSGGWELSYTQYRVVVKFHIPQTGARVNRSALFITINENAFQINFLWSDETNEKKNRKD